MIRQHAAPILVPADGSPASAMTAIDTRTSATGVSEAWIQELVHHHPQCLPIAEIDPIFVNPVPLCTELLTAAGAIDNLMVTPGGLPVIVECKLWRNPEGRREVVGQILDYAKELARWTAADLQREVSKRITGPGNPILRLLGEAGHHVDEVDFSDALTLNLRRGRFLLLIVGDGIREGVEAITEYLQRHAGLNFSLGLVEMPVFALPGGGHVVTPRVIARTTSIVRQVIALPDGNALLDPDDAGVGSSGYTDAPDALAKDRQAFWAEFIGGLELDDPEQTIPRAPRQGYVTFPLPAPQYSSWITVWRDMISGEVGLTLGWTRGQPGESAGLALLEDKDAVLSALAGDARVADIRGRITFTERRDAGDLAHPDLRQAAFAWLRTRLNAWVNVFRPRIRSIALDIGGGEGR